MWQFHQRKVLQITSVHNTAIYVHLVPRKIELHSWREKRSLRLLENGSKISYDQSASSHPCSSPIEAYYYHYAAAAVVPQKKFLC